jgi:hypothetical protein
LRKQTVVSFGKGDYINADSNGNVFITPASVDLSGKSDISVPAVKRLALAPSPAKIEKSFKLKRTEKQAVVAQRRIRLAEENCLARAVYFEARSESELGQLAVARVILNRTKTWPIQNQFAAWSIRVPTGAIHASSLLLATACPMT